MTRFNGGIAIGDKETITSVYNQNGLNSSWRFGYGVNVHDEPSKFSALPSSKNVLSGTYVSGPVLQDEPRWIVTASPWASAVFMYGSLGNIYQEDASGNWTLVRATGSVGQGMCVYNDYLYYVQDTRIGRYGPLDGNAQWNDSWQTGLNSTNALGFAPALPFGFGMAVGHGSSVAFYGGNIDIPFSAGTAYSVGQVVSYAGQYWSCVSAYTPSLGSSAPNADGTHWSWTGTSTPPLQWNLSAIQLPAGVSCMSLARSEQYLAIGTVGSNSVFDNENGYIFMWDGSSPQWNFFNNIEQGSNNFVANYRNQVLSVNGSQGMLYLGFDPFLKVHQLPKIPITGRVQVYPGAVTSWKGGVYIGFGARSSDPNFVRGVYRWGAKVNAYPDALTCDYLISTGNTGSTVQVTACTGLGNALYIGWRDGNAVGVDKVVYSNSPTALARIDFLVFDDGRVPQQKKADTVVVTHSALRPGESVSIYYRPDRSDLPTAAYLTTPVLTHSYSAGDQEPNVTRWSPATDERPRFYELELGVSIGCAGTTAPEVYGVSMKYDDLVQESKV